MKSNRLAIFSGTWILLVTVSALHVDMACAQTTTLAAKQAVSTATGAALQGDVRGSRSIIEAWRIEYNSERPHSSLGNRTPYEFANSRQANNAEQLFLPADSTSSSD